MSKFFTFLLLLSFGVSKAQTTNLIASGNEVDVMHTVLNLYDFNWQKKQVKGSATISLVVLRPTDSIRLDAGFLTINSIKLNNNILLQFTYDGGDKPLGLIVHLNKIYSVNSEITFMIDYHTNYINESDPNNLGGSYGKGIRFFQPTKSNPVKRKQLWSNGEPEGNKYWYPCIESLNDLRTTELIATVEGNLTLISNGKLIETKPSSNGTKTYHYKSETAYPNYLTTIIVGEYVSVLRLHNQIPFITFCYPDEKEAAIASSNRLVDMAAYFSEYIGTAYPYPNYSQVMVQDCPFPGLTGQHTVSTISDNFIDDERTHNDFLYLWDGVESEALAAQWFGNLVASENWNHVWLTKALAHFIEGKYAAQKNGNDEYLMWYQSFDMRATLGDWSAGIHHPVAVEKIEDLNSFLTGDNYLRSRGTLVLRLLEMEIGAETFKKSIQYFVNHHSNKTVTTKDFQNAIELVSKRNLDWFFDQWIYKMGQPKFVVTQNYDDTKKLLLLKFVQTQQEDSGSAYQQVNYFRGKLQLEIDGNLHSVDLKAISENSFTIPLPQKPAFINVNYENTWVAEIEMQKSLQEYLHQFENSKDILARINALNELANIYKDSTSSLSNKEVIYQSMLKVADSKAYWRFRINVLSTLNTLLPKPFDVRMKTVLLKIIQTEKAWLKANAISVLGAENNAGNAELFIHQLNDSSDRVIFNAAVALGKTKSDKAFEALQKLVSKPSWKGQSKMAALTGFQLLGDERAVPIALDILKDNQSPRWFLGASGWDYPVYAATTLASFNKGHLGYEIILERLNQALLHEDINDVFSNTLLISILADSRGTEVFEILKAKYKNDKNAMNAVNMYEEQFKSALKK